MKEIWKHRYNADVRRRTTGSPEDDVFYRDCRNRSDGEKTQLLAGYNIVDSGSRPGSNSVHPALHEHLFGFFGEFAFELGKIVRCAAFTAAPEDATSRLHKGQFLIADRAFQDFFSFFATRAIGCICPFTKFSPVSIMILIPVGNPNSSWPQPL